ncbi:hypothetical protein DFH09DRAFT_1206062 [Mycena vulgaris]|nr:hypothetical protein DFH09DRAFT_1206062 [Mycena vulgaris]
MGNRFLMIWVEIFCARCTLTATINTCVASFRGGMRSIMTESGVILSPFMCIPIFATPVRIAFMHAATASSCQPVEGSTEGKFCALTACHRDLWPLTGNARRNPRASMLSPRSSRRKRASEGFKRGRRGTQERVE